MLALTPMNARLVSRPLFSVLPGTLMLILVFTGLAPAASSATMITYGTGNVVQLLPNTAGQAVPFTISGGTSIDGLELDLQVADGGAFFGGTDTGPFITGVDLITGTIFEGAGPTQADVVAAAMARQSTVDTGSAVAANGLIGTVTFSTVGVTNGSYNLLLTGVGGSFDTTVFDGSTPLSTTVSNGSIVVAAQAIPEPSAAVLCLVGTAALLGVGRRHAASE